MKLEKHPGGPILSPDPSVPWMSRTATNPGAWADPETGEVTMLFRCADWDIAHVRHIGLARSADGVHFKVVGDRPVMSPQPDAWDAGALEDPRVVKFGEWYAITYAAFPALQGEYWDWPDKMRYRGPARPEVFPAALRRNLTSTGLALTRDFRTFLRPGRMTDPTEDDRDVILFPERIGGRFWRLSRPAFRVGPGHGCEAPSIWIAASDDLLRWPEADLMLLAKAKYDWEGTKIGANTPPLRTEAGWLILYHGVSEADRYYRIGAMLLDLEDPTVVRHRTPDWLMEPTEPWEREGYYNGVVFPCGAVVLDGRLHVYYGGGDIHCGLATCDLAALVEHLRGCPS